MPSIRCTNLIECLQCSGILLRGRATQATCFVREQYFVPRTKAAAYSVRQGQTKFIDAPQQAPPWELRLQRILHEVTCVCLCTMWLGAAVAAALGDSGRFIRICVTRGHETPLNVRHVMRHVRLENTGPSGACRESLALDTFRISSSVESRECDVLRACVRIFHGRLKLHVQGSKARSPQNACVLRQALFTKHSLSMLCERMRHEMHASHFI